MEGISRISLNRQIEKILPTTLIEMIERTLLKIFTYQNPPKQLLELLKDQVQLKHYSNRTVCATSPQEARNLRHARYRPSAVSGKCCWYK
jgi:hypothetical protein